MTDTELLGEHFNTESFTGWRTLLKALYALPLSDEELKQFTELTNRENAPEQAFKEMWLVVGRRGGKSQISALLAVYAACFIDYTDRLSPGEVATIACISADRKSARAVFRYVSGLLNSNPILKGLIVREDRESIELSNRTCIEISTASFRSSRGYTFAMVICDEIAFWRSDDSANPDAEIINALRPGLATLDGQLIALSSPYAKRGELWRHYSRYYGSDNAEILIAQAASQKLNPTLPDRVIAAAKERDLASAMAEYMAEFRNDIASFIDVEVLNRCTRSEPLTLPPMPGVRYMAFVDPSGGGSDEYSLCIGHIEKPYRLVVDLLVGQRRVNPATVTTDYAKLLKTYNVFEVTGDRYAGQWVAQEFSKNGITYHYSEKNRSELYLDSLQSITAGQVELAPDEKLINQFQHLERRTSRAGRDVIDHSPGLHDDRANAVAGFIALSHKLDKHYTTPHITWAL